MPGAVCGAVGLVPPSRADGSGIICAPRGGPGGAARAAAAAGRAQIPSLFTLRVELSPSLTERKPWRGKRESYFFSSWFLIESVSARAVTNCSAPPCRATRLQRLPGDPGRAHAGLPAAAARCCCPVLPCWGGLGSCRQGSGVLLMGDGKFLYPLINCLPLM